jgi:hypothetical protein
VSEYLSSAAPAFVAELSSLSAKRELQALAVHAFGDDSGCSRMTLFVALKDGSTIVIRLDQSA